MAEVLEKHKRPAKWSYWPKELESDIALIVDYLKTDDAQRLHMKTTARRLREKHGVPITNISLKEYCEEVLHFEWPV